MTHNNNNNKYNKKNKIFKKDFHAKNFIIMY